MDNKPYFAKWLPVEGEIKKGDKFFDKHFPNFGIQTARWSASKVQEQSRMKLFLCSHDIKVGEKVFYQMEGFKTSEGIFTSIDEEEGIKAYIITGKESVYVFYPDNAEVSPLSEHPFKVIGEISEDALSFVKGEDEFNEEEIFREVLVKDYLGEDDYTEINACRIKGTDEVGDGKKWGDELITIRPIKIRCSCCGKFS